MYLINTFLGFLIAQVYDILRREKQSQASPEKFDVIFFIKDTWMKIVTSLVLSFSISVAVHLNWESAVDLFSGDVSLNDLIYLVIGAVPELVLQWMKRKGGFLQAENVDGFNRK